MALTQLGPWIGPTGDYVLSRTVATTGIQVGDLMRVAFVGYNSGDSSATATPAPPAGWTIHSSGRPYGASYTLFFYTASKIADAADEAAQSFTFTVSDLNAGTNGGGALMWAWRGADTTTPFESAVSALISTGATATPPVATSTTADGVLENVYFEEGSASAAPTLPAGLTSAGTLVDSSNGGALRAAYIALAASGAQAQYSSTLSNSVNISGASAGFAASMIVRAAASAPPGRTLVSALIEPPDALSMSATLASAGTLNLSANLTEAPDTLAASATLPTLANLTLNAALIEAYDALAMACTLQSGGGSSLPVVVAHTVKADVSAQGTSPMVTPAIDTTGATHILAQLLTQGLGTYGSITDSYGNTWTQVGSTHGYAGINAGSYLFECADPVVGPGHTFQLNKQPAYADNEASLWIVALGNTAGRGAYSYDGANTNTGSVTTTGPNSLVVQFWGPADYSGGGNIFTQPPGWTELDPVDYSSGYSFAATGNMNTGSNAYVDAPTQGAITGTWSASLTVQSTQSMWTVEMLAGGGGGGGLTLAADLLDAADLFAAAMIAQAAMSSATAEAADAPTAQAASASSLSAAVQETTDALGATATTLSAAQALLADAADGTAATAAASLSVSSASTEPMDALAALLQAALSMAAASTEAQDAIAARLVPIVQGAMYVDLAELPDLLTLAATAQSLAAAVLADGSDGLASSAASAAAAAANLAETADATAVQIATEATAQLAVAVIEAPDDLVCAVQAALLASAVLTTTDALQASANAAAIAHIATLESADALAVLLAQQPDIATLDPRYIATLAARAFLSVRTARAYLAILRMGTTMTDEVEDKDPAEPAEITFSFDEALAPGITLTGATVLAVQPLGGIDGAAATWGAALTATVGAIDGIVGGKTLPAGRYARVVVPPGAGLSGLRYLIAVQGATADPDVAPVCKAILPVIR